MKKLPLSVPFSLALVYALLGSALFPHIHFHPFAPFQVILAYKVPLKKALFLASVSGLVIDLFSSHLYFGLYALNYCLSLFFLYNQKRHFFEDKPFSIPLFTILISALSTLIELIFLGMAGHQIPLSPKFLAVELCAMPIADGIYAYLWFYLPCRAYLFIQKQGVRVLLKKCLDSVKKITQGSES